jgi:probable rRNA maturation factor
MANVAISIRLDSPEAKDLISSKTVNLDDINDWKQIAENVYQATFKPYFSNHEVVLSFCKAAEIQKLNSYFRNIDEPTDVLSFNSIGNLSEDLSKFDDLTQVSEELEPDATLGDVIICIEKAQIQAKEKNISLKEELQILFIHGLLHLLGYDHETPEEAREMFALQEKIITGNFSIQSLK